VNRDRLIAMGAIPTHSIEAAISELEYCAQAGLKGVMLNTFPSGKSYPTSEDDRFYRAAIDLDMSLTVHVGMQLPTDRFSSTTRTRAKLRLAAIRYGY
jgi:predicted TIM-barrel fold metal-dependent hydrolase